jgi:CMP-N-acetylneuraminic acid synthetase
MPATLAVIPARGGSKGIPRKNLAMLAGRPLIAHMIGHALAVDLINDLVVSTEDEEIAETARALGAQVPFLRPAELAGDRVPSLPVVQHAVTEMERRRGARYDFVVLLQATAPLCRPEDIRACLTKLAQGNCDSAVTVVRVASHHPFRLKRIVGDDLLINYIDQGFEDMRPRQVLPPVFKRSGAAYASTRRVVMEEGALVGTLARAVVVPDHTGLDIDGPLDLALAELILKGTAGDGR